MTAVHAAPVSGNGAVALCPATVLAALPESLRSGFLALPGDGFLKLEHNDTYVSANHRAEQLHAATRALTAAGYDVFPMGWRLEVSARPERVEAEACECCGSPSPFSCICPEYLAEVA